MVVSGSPPYNCVFTRMLLRRVKRIGVKGAILYSWNLQRHLRQEGGSVWHRLRQTSSRHAVDQQKLSQT